MIFYLTVGDQPSGVYFSQVCDVCKYLSEITGETVHLISVISLRQFRKNRSLLKNRYAATTVLPAWPGIDNWQKNYPLIKRAISKIVSNNEKKLLICRGPLAANIGIKLKKHGTISISVYDGRGANQAELQEYQVTSDQDFVNSMFEWEKKAVLESDYRMAVSNQLVNYWNETFGYEGEGHVVIPCTLNQSFRDKQSAREELRKQMQIGKEEILLVYSGSSAGWQSFELAGKILINLMARDHRIKVLFLSNISISDLRWAGAYKKRLTAKWVKHEEVPGYLQAADYALLIREKSVTNRVASPTKFAEYLSAGLPVIISEEIGDFSEFVKVHQAGMTINEGSDFQLNPVTAEERKRLQLLAFKYFTKNAYEREYLQVLNLIK